MAERDLLAHCHCVAAEPSEEVKLWRPQRAFKADVWKCFGLRVVRKREMTREENVASIRFWGSQTLQDWKLRTPTT